jgi:hypothetical protein
MPKTRNRNRDVGPFNNQDTEQIRTQLAVIEDEWLKSRLEGNLEFSEQLIDDSYQGITSNGCPQTKAEFLEAISRSACSQSHGGCFDFRVNVSSSILERNRWELTKS